LSELSNYGYLRWKYQIMFLKDIYIYPIKSLGGIRMDEAILEEKGFRNDRRWMLVDESGMFLSQRTHPQMALLQVAIQADGLEVSHKQNVSLKLKIPFEPATDKIIPVTIWEDTVEGQVVSEAVNEWFTEIMEMPCALVKMPGSTQRKLKAKYAVNGESVSYADGMPYLIIGQESLNDLNTRLEKPVPMDRFRPNLVFSGGSAFVEDEWKTVKIGGATFKVTKPCARCVMTTVDQSSAMKSKEPLKTLASYRTIDHNVMFGQNMLLLGGEKVKIGDLITVI
jgi:uncharacterized protein YcbX